MAGVDSPGGVYRPPEQLIVTIRPGLQITDTCLRVGNRHFELNALDSLATQQSSHDPLTRNAAMLALIGAVVLGVGARYMHPAGVVASLGVLAGLAVLAIISSRHRPRRLELWANYRGQATQLFVSDDWWLFGAVERHLRRALTEERLGYSPVPRAAVESVVPHPSAMHPSKMHPANL